MSARRLSLLSALENLCKGLARGGWRGREGPLAADADCKRPLDEAGRDCFASVLIRVNPCRLLFEKRSDTDEHG